MKYKISVDRKNQFLIVQAAADAAVTGFTSIGEVDHPDAALDPLGWQGNHVMQQHIRDLCYHAGIQDMHRYPIVDMVGLKFEKDFRDFFFSLKADGEMDTVTGYPAVGMQLIAVTHKSDTDPGRIYMRFHLADKAKIETAALRINGKACQLIEAQEQPNDVIVAQYMMPILALPVGTPIYGRFTRTD